jgi:hypothetical protein
MQPLQELTSEQIASIMPATASRDLIEWSDSPDFVSYCNQVLRAQISVQSVLNTDPSIRITDDQPYNEYFFLRRLNLFGRFSFAPRVSLNP